MMLPAQYETGKAYFMDFELDVNRKTFIPRPETEILVEMVLEAAKKELLYKKELFMLDMCTGSGNIAISLTKYINNSKIVALDISLDALKTARSNALKLGVNNRVKFVQGDLFSGLSVKNKFDIIISNPPYINASDMEALSDEVKAEPCVALFGGDDGLDFYRTISARASEYLAKGSYVFLEIGYDQGGSVIDLFKENGYRDVQVFKDYAGIDRIVKAKWIHS